MRVIAQETIFFHRKLETEKTLLKVEICRFLHLPGHVEVLEPLMGLMTKMSIS